MMEAQLAAFRAEEEERVAMLPAPRLPGHGTPQPPVERDWLQGPIQAFQDFSQRFIPNIDFLRQRGGSLEADPRPAPGDRELAMGLVFPTEFALERLERRAHECRLYESEVCARLEEAARGTAEQRSRERGRLETDLLRLQGAAEAAMREAEAARQRERAAREEQARRAEEQRRQEEQARLRREREEAERQKRERDLVRARNDVAALLDPKCPRCQAVFDGFDGCAALYCRNCPCKFCALCLKDCGDDAHQHVRACPQRGNAMRDDYFLKAPEMQVWQSDVLVPQRRAKLERFWAGLDPAMRVQCSSDAFIKGTYRDHRLAHLLA